MLAIAMSVLSVTVSEIIIYELANLLISICTEFMTFKMKIRNDDDLDEISRRTYTLNMSRSSRLFAVTLVYIS